MDATKKAAVEKKMVLALLALFGLVLVGSLKNAGLLGQRAAKKGVSAGRTHGEAKTLPEAMQEHWQQMEPRVDAQPTPRPGNPTTDRDKPAYAAQSLRDPFKSLLPDEEQAPQVATPPTHVATPVAAPPPNLTVRGVLLGSEPQAIIDDEVYQVGQTVQGMKILSIDRHGVTVEFNGQPLTYPTSSGSGSAGPRTGSQQARWR